ncbi:MAG: histidine kinase [Bacteroidetes bacterium]|nr:histidine kinase [Bacteroidota bacterium]
MKYLLLVWWLAFSFALNAQSYTNADSIKIYRLLAAADASEEMSQALQLAKQALDLSQKTTMLRGEGWANLKIAFLLVEHTPNTDVRQYWDIGTRIATQLNDPFMFGMAQVQQGKYWMYNNDLVKAAQFYQKALSTYFEKEQSQYTAVLYNDLGMVAGKQNQRDLEAGWYLKAMKLHENLGNLHGWANSAGNLANTFFRLGNQTDAIKYAKEALHVHTKNNNVSGLATVAGNLSTMYASYNQLDSAVLYRQKAMKYAEINGQTKHLIQGHQNLALLFDRQQKYAEALKAIQRAIDLSRSTNDLVSVAAKSRIAAEISAKMGDTLKMNQYYVEATQLADLLQRKEVLRDVYLSKSTFYARTNDFKRAFDYSLNYHFLKDSLEGVLVKNNISELQIKYESERKDFEIAKLSTEKLIRQLEIDKQKALIAGNRLEAQRKEDQIQLLIQQQKLREAALRQQKELFEKQLLITKNKEQELQLARQRLELTQKDKELQERQLQRQRLFQLVGGGAFLFMALLAWILFNRYQLRKQLQEKEALLAIRNNISKDLHDEIGSSLTNVNILNELTKRTLSTPLQAQEYLQQAGESIQQISESLGDIVWNINPEYDDLQKILIRMRRYASDMLDGANIFYHLEFPDESSHFKLPMNKRRDFYLLYKEAINNMVKYSKATKAVVRLTLAENELSLLVQDNGIGFDVQTVRKGNGLNNMHYRAELLKSNLKIQSQPQQGTTIELVMKV